MFPQTLERHVCGFSKEVCHTHRKRSNGARRTLPSFSTPSVVAHPRAEDEAEEHGYTDGNMVRLWRRQGSRDGGNTRGRSLHRVAAFVGVVAFLCVFLALSWSVFWGIRLKRDGQALSLVGEELLRAARNRNLTAVEQTVPRAREDIRTVGNDLHRLRGIFLIPGLRSEGRVLERILSEATYLVDAADVAGRLFRELAPVSEKIRTANGFGEGDLSMIRRAVVARIPDARRLAARGKALTSGGIPESRSARLNDIRKKLAEPVRLMERVAEAVGESGEAVFPLLGVDRERTFLLLFQNADEIRPGGGIISVYGIITVRGGQIAVASVEHVGKIYARNTNPPTKAPTPIARLVFPTMTLPNINWDADPTVWLPRAYAMWNVTNTPTVDGVIAIGTPVLQDLVRAVGPLRLPGFAGEFTTENVVPAIDAITDEADKNRPGATQNYAIFRTLVETILARVNAVPMDEHMLPFLAIAARRAFARDLAMFTPDQGEQRLLRTLGLLRPVPVGVDELFLVDANLGSAKADAKMRRTLALTVNLQDVLRPTSRAVVTYDFHRGRPDARTWPYRGYLQLFVPRGSVVETFSGGQDETDVAVDNGRTVFGNYIFVNFGEVVPVDVRYTLPEVVTQRLAEGVYALTLRKQGGIELPYTVVVNLPSRWSSSRVAATNGTTLLRPEGKSVRVEWTGTLVRDATLVVER